LSEMVAQLCARQVQGQTFFCIPYRPSLVNARERIDTAMVTVLNGEVTSKQIEDELTRLMSEVWRWTTHKGGRQQVHSEISYNSVDQGLE
jgi:hypothetical protein